MSDTNLGEVFNIVSMISSVQFFLQLLVFPLCVCYTFVVVPESGYSVCVCVLSYFSLLFSFRGFYCYVKGTFHAGIGMLKDRKSKHLTEAEDIKKTWQGYTEELYKKDFHDPDNHDDVVTCWLKTQHLKN